MLSDDLEKKLLDLAGRYLNPQAYDLELLKELLEEPNNQEKADDIQEALSVTIDGDGVSQEQWEDATDDEIDGEAEWIEYLSKIHDYLFENGPFPFPGGDDDIVDDDQDEHDDE